MMKINTMTVFAVYYAYNNPWINKPSVGFTVIIVTSAHWYVFQTNCGLYVTKRQAKPYRNKHVFFPQAVSV